MSKLQRALKGVQPPGIYQLASGASVKFMKSEADRAGFKLYYLDGKKIKSKATFLDIVAKVIAFPSYFGKNWDALNDTLTDMSWAQPASGYIILFQSPEYFMQAAPDDWDVALDILKTTVEFWNQANVPFYVLLRGPGLENYPVL